MLTTILIELWAVVILRLVDEILFRSKPYNLVWSSKVSLFGNSAPALWPHLGRPIYFDADGRAFSASNCLELLSRRLTRSVETNQTPRIDLVHCQQTGYLVIVRGLIELSLPFSPKHMLLSSLYDKGWFWAIAAKSSNCLTWLVLMRPPSEFFLNCATTNIHENVHSNKSLFIPSEPLIVAWNTSNRL